MKTDVAVPVCPPINELRASSLAAPLPPWCESPRRHSGLRVRLARWQHRPSAPRYTQCPLVLWDRALRILPPNKLHHPRRTQYLKAGVIPAERSDHTRSEYRCSAGNGGASLLEVAESSALIPRPRSRPQSAALAEKAGSLVREARVPLGQQLPQGRVSMTAQSTTRFEGSWHL